MSGLVSSPTGLWGGMYGLMGGTALSTPSGLLADLISSPTLSLNFANATYQLNNTNYAIASVPGYSFTRSSGGYAENLDGSLTYFAGTRTNVFFPSNGSTAFNILNNVAVTATNVAGAPDGTSTATTLTRAAIIGDDRALRNITVANDNTAYTYSIFIRSGPSQQTKIALNLNGGTINPSVFIVVDIATGAIISGTGIVTKVGSWWRISVSITNNTSGNTILGANLYPTTAYPSLTTGSVDYWGIQVETATDTRITYPTAYIPTTTAAVSVDTPRITNKGYLSEEARTNALLQSQNFDNASWNKNNVTITADQTTAPDGTLTADLINEGTAAAIHCFYGTNYANPAGPSTISVYIKGGTRRYVSIRGESTAAATYAWVTIDTQTGAISSNASILSASATLSTNGFYRVVFSFSSAGLASGNIVIAGSSVSTAPTTSTVLGDTYTGTSSTFYVWGAQVEQASFATSYIPTTTAAATRAADVLKITGNFMGSGPWTWLTDVAIAFRTISGAPTPGNFYLNSSNYLTIYCSDGTAGLINLNGKVAGTDLFNVQLSGLFAGSSAKIGMALISGNVYGSVNGSTSTSLGTNTVFSPTQTSIGYSGTGNQINGYVRGMTVWNTQFSTAQLQAITT